MLIPNFAFKNFSYEYLLLLFSQNKQISKIFGLLDSNDQMGYSSMLISSIIFLVVSLRRVAPNTIEQRSRSGLCEGVIRREATETEGLVILITE